jgi:hypothetical protein
MVPKSDQMINQGKKKEDFSQMSGEKVNEKSKTRQMLDMRKDRLEERP